MKCLQLVLTLCTSIALIGCNVDGGNDGDGGSGGDGTTNDGSQLQQWRYAHEEFEGDVQDVYAYKFKEYVENNSDHFVQVFRFGELGESDNIMEQTQAGVLQFVNQSPGFTGALIPEAQIFFIPYLLPTDEQMVIEFFNNSVAINEMFPEMYADQGLELLQMYPEGEMVVTTNKPINSPDDLRGMNIRTMTNPLLAATYQAFGASPTPLPWRELYGGLQTGILDGQENPLFWIESGRLYEVSPNLTFTGHSWFTTALMANQSFYNGLDSGDQQLVRDASDFAYEYITKYISGLAKESLAAIEAASDDVTVNRLSEEEIAAFRERAPLVEQRFLEMTSDRGAALLDQFKTDLNALVDN